VKRDGQAVLCNARAGAALRHPSGRLSAVLVRLSILSVSQRRGARGGGLRNSASQAPSGPSIGADALGARALSVIMLATRALLLAAARRALRPYSTAPPTGLSEGERTIWAKLQDKFSPTELQVADVSGAPPSPRVPAVCSY
jgi:hypothetical protein